MTYNPANQEYSIADYDPNWAVQFQKLNLMLQKLFGSKALAIHHVGSTSVPGMKSKPIIDVLVVVREVEEFAEEKDKMRTLGYVFLENYICPDSIVFQKNEGNRRLENIHVIAKGQDRKIREFLDTRDYLRAHRERVRAYGELKEKLFTLYPNDYVKYREGKDGFLKETFRLAEEWRKGDCS